MGAWEGLSFSQIKQQFPELYELRGQNPQAHIPPNGETLEAGQARVDGAVQRILSKTTGDIAIVAHSGINRLLLCKYKEIGLNEWINIPQPYCCVTELTFHDPGNTR
jgi:probable phosphoglycerate mutase